MILRNLSNAYILNYVGYQKMKRMKIMAFNWMLKNIPYHIKGELKRIPLMPAHPCALLYRKLPPSPRDAEQHTNGTAGEYWFHRQQEYPAQTHAETCVKLLIEATSSSAESNIFGRFAISQLDST